MTYKSVLAAVQGLPKGGDVKPSNNQMLQFYGHFKQATFGNATGKRPSAFSMVARAKYDAHAALKGMTRAQAEAGYVRAAKSLCDAHPTSMSLGSLRKALAPAPAASKSVNGVKFSAKNVTGEVDSQGVCLITIHSPPVNSLSRAMRADLMQVHRSAVAHPSVKAIVFTGRGPAFIGGADIKEMSLGQLGEALSPGIDEIEASEKPVVMALNGFALGGGLETAMAGHARVASTKCVVSLPELQLGIIPGAGGTQRLPRLVGLQTSIDMIIASKRIRASAALELGLVDQVVEPKAVVAAAKAKALSLVGQDLSKLRTSSRTDKLGSPSDSKRVIDTNRIFLKKNRKMRNQFHQQAALDAIEDGLVNGYSSGIVTEERLFNKTLKSPQCAGLMQVFLSSRTCARVPGITDHPSAKNVKLPQFVAVLGGGTMGSGIATWMLSKNKSIRVILKELDRPGALEAARGRVEGFLKHAVKRKKMSPKGFEQAMSRLTVQAGYENFDKLDMVIEAVFENPKVKKAIFKELEGVCSPTCVLASNTSTISIDDIASAVSPTNRPRVVGAHFFSPAHVMPLVEVIKGSKSAPAAVASVIKLSKGLGKTAVTVGDCSGFVVNRIFYPYGQAASYAVVHLGIDLYELDAEITKWGMPMGPFRMTDLTGCDIGLHAGSLMGEHHTVNKICMELLQKMVATKNLGEKTKSGHYKNFPRAEPNREVTGPFLAEIRKELGVDISSPKFKLSKEELVPFVMSGVANEAFRCLEEKISHRATDIDIACVTSMGFPAYRGGIFCWAKAFGVANLVALMRKWEAASGLAFFRPCALMARTAASETARF